MSNTSSSSKTHSKKSKDSGRDRDKSKTVASEASSQCDTPPLLDKDGGSSQGKFAGVGPDSIYCIAEQVCMEITPEAATNLAEDVSYKLRQMISSISLQSELMKKSRVDTWDVNTALALADTSPSMCTTANHFTQVGDEKIYTDVEELVNVCDLALTPQTCIYSSHPVLSTEWITDEKSQNHTSIYSSNISVHLQNYYTKVARSILNLRKKPKEVAVRDLMTNTRIGPIFPNLFNLAVLVLNDDNLNALNVPAKKPLQSNVLDMVDALCSNPCSLDTNIQQQFQRLFPVMVSNILGNGSMSEKMVNILTKITRTWPSFITIGKSILFEYLSHSTKDRLTGPMIKCVMALGRQALYECLNSEDNLDHLDDCLMADKGTQQQAGLRATMLVSDPMGRHALYECLNSEDNLDHLDDCLMADKGTQQQAGLRATMLDVSTVLLRSEPTTYCEEYVGCDYVLYEMLGDSIDPRRTIFPKSKETSSDDTDTMTDEDLSFAHRSNLRRPKIRIIPSTPRIRNGIHKDPAFEPTRFSSDTCIRLKIKNCRTIHVPRRHQAAYTHPSHAHSKQSIVVASGLLLRFKYKLNKPNAPPYLGALLL